MWGSEFSQCAGKEPFKTPAAAARAKKALAKRRNARPREGFEVYRCCFCSQWHLGHKTKQNHQALLRDKARHARRHSPSRPES